MITPLALTWWGHASSTVELGSARIGLDPLLADRLFHLRRDAPTPGARALEVDIVLVSHLHADHYHVPSLRRLPVDVPLVVPAGGEPLLRGVDPGRIFPVRPGDQLDVAGVHVEVLPATHDGHRLPRSRLVAPALGFRVTAAGCSCWYPGDTELRDDLVDIEPVDLALVPIGGWGPTLADGHLGPQEAAVAVGRVGAAYAAPVHWGTFWPVGLKRLAPANHRRLFVTPGDRFAEAMAHSGGGARVVPVGHGERTEL